MSLFFGKISKKFDTKQIEEGYYQAAKSSSWFGSIQLGDIVYLIGGDKIQLWKAKEWKNVEGNDRLYFEILNTNLGINVNDFIALDFLKLSKALIVLSSRSARNRAFFKLTPLKTYTVEELSQTSFYKSEDLYRSIKLIEQDEIDPSSKDIQLFLQGGSLKLVKSDFYDEDVYKSFRDNLKYYGHGAKHKDGTFAKISNGLKNHATISRSEVSLRAFYDAFFCDYDEKNKFYLVGAYWDDHVPQDMTSIFVKENRWANGYDDKFIKDVKAIPEGSHIAIKSAYVVKKSISVMMIKARGKVVKNHINGQDLDVEWETNFQPFEVDFGGYLTTVKEVKDKDQIAAIWENEIEPENLNDMANEYVELLKYKKQIILQGPPGTGKTKLAKEIASHLINNGNQIDRYPEIDDLLLSSSLKAGVSIPSVGDRAMYEVKKIDTGQREVLLIKESGKLDNTSFDKITDYYKRKFWEKEISNNDDRRAASIAKFIYNQNSNGNIADSKQFKIIQFHPSYTYEDFVRGIVSKPNPDGEGIVFEAKNKMLASFANDALENFRLSQSDTQVSQAVIQVKSDLQRFAEHVREEIANSEDQKYSLTPQIYLFDSDNKRFKYKGDNWIRHEKGLNMKYSELEKLIQAGITERADIKSLDGLESTTKEHATYFFNTIEKYYKFIEDNKKEIDSVRVKEATKLKNFVMIIDEINRANLSSVLGELVYALEYRNEKVESIYEIEDSNELILPPNLYIIGTMNTADRSVGHIDYAIRRRFAFVDVLPKALTDVEFEADLFNMVSALFVKDKDTLEPSEHLSSEFRPQDVWLGHSYFIKDPNVDFKTKLKYEVLPILEEYIKDGVLRESPGLAKEISHLKSLA